MPSPLFSLAETTMKNIPESIENKIGTNLHKQKDHPIFLVKQRIFEFFQDLQVVDYESPYVSVHENFDSLRIPADHPSRKSSDTFYNEQQVLRTHMTSYICPTVKKGIVSYITCGDVYRKDEIDQTHYPIFHQIDAFHLVEEGVDVKTDLRKKIAGLIQHLFGKDCQYEFLEDYNHKDVYFPFTIDSFEVNVTLNVDGKKRELEVLGAGTVHPEIMKSIGLEGRQAWAFGMGIERLAMVFYSIPDIRLFWSKDERFLKQFRNGENKKFVPYSKYEVCYKDISFYVGESYSANDFYTIVRDTDKENIVESIELKDEFTNKGKKSKCYRINYRSMERTVTNHEVDNLQNKIREKCATVLNLELR